MPVDFAAKMNEAFERFFFASAFQLRFECCGAAMSLNPLCL